MHAASADSAPTAVVAADAVLAPDAAPTPDTCVEVTPTGPGQGTFSSGAQTGAGYDARRRTRTLPFIDPFPVVRISGRFKGKRTTLTRVTVNAPRGARIRITCTRAAAAPTSARPSR